MHIVSKKCIFCAYWNIICKKSIKHIRIKFRGITLQYVFKHYLENWEFLSKASPLNIKFNLALYALVLMVDFRPLHVQLQFSHIKWAHSEDQLSSHNIGKSNCRETNTPYFYFPRDTRDKNI